MSTSTVREFQPEHPTDSRQVKVKGPLDHPPLSAPEVGNGHHHYTLPVFPLSGLFVCRDISFYDNYLFLCLSCYSTISAMDSLDGEFNS